MISHKKEITRVAKTSQAGFTLLEVALAVVIGGMLLAMFGQSLVNTLNESKIRTTQHRIAEINNALLRFSSYSNHLPCPADRTIPAPVGGVAQPNYNAAVANCSVGTAAAGTVSSGGVRIGGVPTRTLNLPDEYAFDAWGMRLIYAVTEKMAMTATMDATRGCNTAAGVDPNNDAHKGGACVSVTGNPRLAAFAVVSTGQDRQGSFTINGGAGAACAAAPGADTENCDDDANFTDALQVATAGVSYFDDFIEYETLDADIDEIPPGAVLPFRLNECPKGWDRMPETEGHIIVGRGPFTNPAPSGATGPYPTTPVALGQTGGSATRMGNPIGALTGVSEYANYPPYIVYRYCVKS